MPAKEHVGTLGLMDSFTQVTKIPFTALTSHLLQKLEKETCLSELDLPFRG